MFLKYLNIYLDFFGHVRKWFDNKNLRLRVIKDINFLTKFKW